jgi:hypothetical protein
LWLEGGVMIDPNKAVDFIIQNAPKFAKAKAERVYLEEYRKSLKALLMSQSGSQSLGAQERDAYAHEDYTALLEGLKAAVEAEEKIRWEIVAAQARIEIWRSEQANNRMIERLTV